MTSLAVVNPKGGSGKTTIAALTLSFLAGKGLSPWMLDTEKTGYLYTYVNSVLSLEVERVYQSGNKADVVTFFKRYLSERESVNEWLVMDTPGVAGGGMADIAINNCDILVVPVKPSVPDLQKTLEFAFYALELWQMADKRGGNTAYASNKMFIVFSEFHQQSLLYAEARDFIKKSFKKEDDNRLIILPGGLAQRQGYRSFLKGSKLENKCHQEALELMQAITGIADAN